MKDAVLNILKQQNGAFISGERLANILHLSRAAIWKNIASLRRDGYEIIAITNRGYALKHAPYTLSQQEMQALLQTTVFGHPLMVLEETTSTFDAIRKYPVQEGLTVAAKRQTSGRGRLGRGWTAEPGGIYFSFYLTPRMEPQNAPFVTLQCALAICRSVQKIADCAIKWPNDLVIDGKKICGILTQTSIALDAIEYICAGIGINVNLAGFPSDLPNATSLLLETGAPIDENRLLCDCLTELENIFLHTSRADVLAEYKQHCVTLGSEVLVHYVTQQPEVRGTCMDILPDGALQIRLESGELRTVSSGEVSVRGIYGYS